MKNTSDLFLLLVFMAITALTSQEVLAGMMTYDSKPKSEWQQIWKENAERMGQALTKGDYGALDAYYNGKQHAYEQQEIDESILGWEFEVFGDVFKHLPSHAYIEKWVQSSPNSYAANLVAGQMHYSYGYELRGSKWASETTPQQFEGMKQEFEKAAPYLLKSLTLADKPILSYYEILGTFFNADAAMFAFSPKPESLLSGQDQTVGNIMGKALLDVLTSVSDIQMNRDYSYEDLHKAMWHYADQGLKIAPGSLKITERYLELIKPKWYGSDEMMRSFIEYQYKNGQIKKTRYQYLLATIPWEKARYYGYKKAKYYNPQKAADFYYETAQFLDEADNGPFYYGALYEYLNVSYDIYLANKMDPVREKTLLPQLDYFITSDKNPYKTNMEEDEYNRGYRHILDVRAYVRMVHQKNAKGAWADLSESYRRGSGYAAYKIASTYCEGYPDLVKQDRPTCIKIMKESAKLGHDEAKNVLKSWGESW